MLRDAISRLLVPRRPGHDAAPPGLLHFVREADGRVLRYHLRVERDGSGLLIANASEACRLSPSGVRIARGLLEKVSVEHLAKELLQTFRGLTRETANADIARVRAVMDEMVRPGSRFPLYSLDDASHVHHRMLSAPLVADVELPELERGKQLLAKLWDAAVPQAVLLVPEGGSRATALALVERAEDLGMIIGVRGRATDIGGEDALQALAMAGLDRADVFYAHTDAAVHDALFGEGDHARAHAAFATLRVLGVCPVAVVPLVASTWNAFGDTAGALRDSGVTTVIAYAVVGDGALPRAAVPQTTAFAEETAERLGVAILSTFPVSIEDGDGAGVVAATRRGPRAAGDAAVHVAPDGAVLPADGPAKSAGDLLRDPWSQIWSSPVFARAREGERGPE